MVCALAFHPLESGESFARFGRSPLNCILLLDHDPHHAAAVMAALPNVPCRTIVAPDLNGALHLLHVQPVECAIITCVSDIAWHHQIDFILQAARELPDPPDIICLLRGPYRGPSDRVYAARKGFVLIHE